MQGSCDVCQVATSATWTVGFWLCSTVYHNIVRAAKTDVGKTLLSPRR